MVECDGDNTTVRGDRYANTYCWVIRLADGKLCVGEDARAVAATVLDPPAPLALRPGLRALALAGVALLPEDVQELYDLRLDRARRAVLAAGRGSLRRLALPRVLPGVWSQRGGGLPLRLLDALS